MAPHTIDTIRALGVAQEDRLFTLDVEGYISLGCARSEIARTYCELFGKEWPGQE